MSSMIRIASKRMRVPFLLVALAGGAGVAGTIALRQNRPPASQGEGIENYLLRNGVWVVDPATESFQRLRPDAIRGDCIRNANQNGWTADILRVSERTFRASPPIYLGGLRIPYRVKIVVVPAGYTRFQSPYEAYLSPEGALFSVFLDAEAPARDVVEPMVRFEARGLREFERIQDMLRDPLATRSDSGEFEFDFALFQRTLVEDFARKALARDPDSSLPSFARQNRNNEIFGITLWIARTWGTGPGGVEIDRGAWHLQARMFWRSAFGSERPSRAQMVDRLGEMDDEQVTEVITRSAMYEALSTHYGVFDRPDVSGMLQAEDQLEVVELFRTLVRVFSLQFGFGLEESGDRSPRRPMDNPPPPPVFNWAGVPT